MSDKPKAREKESKDKKGFSRIDLLLLVLIIVFHTINNQIILSKDSVLFTWDKQTNHDYVLEINESLRMSPLEIGNVLSGTDHVRVRYPPVLYLNALLFHSVLGGDEDVSSISVTVFFIAAILFLSLSVLHITGDGTSAIISVIVFSFLRPVIGFSRTFVVDMAFLCLVIASYLVYLKSRESASLRQGLILGLVLGIGLLTKPTFIVFYLAFLALLSYDAMERIYRTGEDRIGLAKQSVAMLLIAIGASLCISLPWYINSMGMVAEYYNSIAPQMHPSGYLAFVLSKALRILKHLTMDAAGIWAGMAFVVSGLVVLMRRTTRREGIRIYLLVGGYLLFLSVNRYEFYEYYILPIFPLLSLTVGQAAHIARRTAISSISPLASRKTVEISSYAIISLLLIASVWQILHLQSEPIRGKVIDFKERHIGSGLIVPIKGYDLDQKVFKSVPEIEGNETQVMIYSHSPMLMRHCNDLVAIGYIRCHNYLERCSRGCMDILEGHDGINQSSFIDYVIVTYPLVEIPRTEAYDQVREFMRSEDSMLVKVEEFESIDTTHEKVIVYAVNRSG